MVPFVDGSLENPEIGYNTAERVKEGIKYHSLQWCFRISSRGRDTGDDRVKYFIDPLSCLRADREDLFPVTSQKIDHLIFDLLHHGRIHVDLVQNRNDGQVMLNRQVKVRDGLGLDTLRGIDHQKGPFAGSDGTGYFVGKIDMAGGIDQVEDVFLTLRLKIHLNGVTLDRNPPFSFQIHIIQHLFPRITIRNSIGPLKETVGQGRFTVVNMGNDAKVAYVFHGRKVNQFISGWSRSR